MLDEVINVVFCSVTSCGRRAWSLSVSHEFLRLIVREEGLGWLFRPRWLAGFPYCVLADAKDCVVKIRSAMLTAGLGGMTLVTATWGVTVPKYDHVVIVMDENKDYSQIIGSADAPYINSLASQGANFTKFYAEEHHSEGNYLWLFSGDRQGLDFNDSPPATQLTTPNLGAALVSHGYTFTGYAENLPAVGSTVTTAAGGYARKHNPYVDWQAVSDAAPGANQLLSTTNQPFTAFPTNYANLPTVSWVVPNLNNDMHDGTVAQGDAWLQTNLGAYVTWAKTHNSLLIFTMDENSQGTAGMTDPANSSNANQICTIMVGANIIPGSYAESVGITHVNILRSLETMYGLPTEGAQATAATAYGISNNAVTDVFAVPEPASVSLLVLAGLPLIRRRRA